MTIKKHKIPGKTLGFKTCFLDMFLKGGIAKSARKIGNFL